MYGVSSFTSRLDQQTDVNGASVGDEDGRNTRKRIRRIMSRIASVLPTTKHFKRLANMDNFLGCNGFSGVSVGYLDHPSLPS